MVEEFPSFIVGAFPGAIRALRHAGEKSDGFVFSYSIKNEKFFLIVIWTIPSRLMEF